VGEPPIAGAGCSAATPPFDAHRARPADVIFEQLENHAIADSKCIEGRAFVHVIPVEEYLATACQPDETAALADEQPYDPPCVRKASPFRRPTPCNRVGRRDRSDTGASAVAHGYHRNSPRRCDRPPAESISTDSANPARPNRSCGSASPASYARLPTYNFRPMIIELLYRTRNVPEHRTMSVDAGFDEVEPVTLP
jgi:hypothetical protein